MSVRVGSARIDENGNLSGGKAGDQTGQEVMIEPWYKHSKGWVVIRAVNDDIRERIARDMEYACANDRIGYDQSTSWDLYDKSKAFGWDCSKVIQDTETDCSSLVRVCVAYAAEGHIPWFSTLNEVTVLRSTGLFEILTNSKYTDEDTYLKRGDILCTRTQGHTVVVIDNGAGVNGEQKMKKWDDVVKKALVMYVHRDQYAYLYGADGEIGSDALVDQKVAAYPSYFAGKNVAAIKEAVRGKTCYDCSGWIHTLFGAPDKSSGAIISDCIDVSTDLVAGVAGSVLWKNGHVGLDIGYGFCLDIPTELQEIRLRKISECDWTKSGRWTNYCDYSGANNR